MASESLIQQLDDMQPTVADICTGIDLTLRLVPIQVRKTRSEWAERAKRSVSRLGTLAADQLRAQDDPTRKLPARGEGTIVCDAAGNEVAGLTDSEEAGPVIVLFNRDGGIAVTVSLDETGAPELVLNNSEGEPTIGAALVNDKPIIFDLQNGRPLQFNGEDS